MASVFREPSLLSPECWGHWQPALLLVFSFYFFNIGFLNEKYLFLLMCVNMCAHTLGHVQARLKEGNRTLGAGVMGCEQTCRSWSRILVLCKNGKGGVGDLAQW